MSAKLPHAFLTDRFERAFAYATAVHAHQVRKATRIPYISHPLTVAALVLEDGGDEDQAIGALLHDAAEDAGGRARLEDIRARFGEAVAYIVDGCSDTYDMPKPDWRERKETYIARFREHVTAGDTAVVRVSLADKLHNARSIIADYREIGEALWARFTTGSRDDQLWYYRSLVEAVTGFEKGRLSIELRRTVEELERLASQRG